MKRFRSGVLIAVVAIFGTRALAAEDAPALPCNSLCRSWMAIGAEAAPAGPVNLVPTVDKAGPAAAAVPLSGRSSPAASSKSGRATVVTVIPAGGKSGEADDKARNARPVPLPPRPVREPPPPPRPAGMLAVLSPPAAKVDASPAGTSPLTAIPSLPVPPSIAAIVVPPPAPPAAVVATITEARLVAGSSPLPSTHVVPDHGWPPPIDIIGALLATTPIRR